MNCYHESEANRLKEERGTKRLLIEYKTTFEIRMHFPTFEGWFIFDEQLCAARLNGYWPVSLFFAVQALLQSISIGSTPTRSPA